MTDTRKEAKGDESGVKIVKLAGTDETFLIQWKSNGLRHTTFRNTFEDAFSLCKELFNYSKDDKMQTPTESNAPRSITEPSFSPEQIEKIREELHAALQIVDVVFTLMRKVNKEVKEDARVKEKFIEFLAGLGEEKAKKLITFWNLDQH